MRYEVWGVRNEESEQRRRMRMSAQNLQLMRTWVTEKEKERDDSNDFNDSMALSKQTLRKTLERKMKIMCNYRKHKFTEILKIETCFERIETERRELVLRQTLKHCSTAAEVAGLNWSQPFGWNTWEEDSDLRLETRTVSEWPVRHWLDWDRAETELIQNWCRTETYDEDNK